MSARPAPPTEPQPQPETNQPGLGDLRGAVANHLRRRFPGNPHVREDAAAGMSLAVGNVPDGMANGFLVGVNPIHGLYATIMGPIVGGALSSTQLMVITTTAAASLTASQPLADMPAEARAAALAVMVVLAGIFQLAFVLLGLTRLTRFVSYSVTTGFLTGIAVLLMLSQLPTVLGYPVFGSNRVMQTIDLLAKIREVNPAALGLAVMTIALARWLPRTPLRGFGRLVAIAVPSAIVAAFHIEGVRIVRDLGEIVRAMPAPDMPSVMRLAPGVLTGALSIAAVVILQGMGVSQSVPNPDGTRTDMSKDIVAQGAANIASGLFRGLPVGGSLSTTALGVMSNARTRWASIFAGLWMALIVFGVPGLVSRVAMPALGALLILAAWASIKPREVVAVWYTGWPSRVAAMTTFLATLFLPIQAAVGLGVVLAALLYVNESATDISIVELVERADGQFEERTPSATLRGGGVTVLDVYGQLFFAGARTLDQMLPRPGDNRNAIVILRLRGRTILGATLVDVLSRYAEELRRVDGRLYLTGLNHQAYDQVIRTRKLRLSGPVRIYEATPVVWESTRMALIDAETWLAEQQERQRGQDRDPAAAAT